MHITTGYRAEAVPPVHRRVESFEGYGAVLPPPASCAGTVQHYHHAIAAERGDAGAPQRRREGGAEDLRAHAVLTDVLGREDVGA